MPSAQLIRHWTNEALTPSKTPPIEVHAILLLLPSAIPINTACDRQLRRIEWRLRYAQAGDGLDDLRRYLRLRSYLYIDKDRFQHGQRNNTRSKMFIERVEVKVRAATAKYRTAREALSNLAETLNISDWDKTYPLLNNNDVHGLRAEEFNGSEGRRTVSWIWGNVGDGARSIESADLKDCKVILNWKPVFCSLHPLALRIEWCKAWARTMRWKEEVVLLQEEMCQVNAFLTTRADRWTDRRSLSGLPTMDGSLKEGYQAFAAQQSALCI